ncbi:class Ib ribonucleoside-diphosphate reductase assembly flavoprotein NrdI [Arthrobacter sp. I2-34]|uniref:Protein NrdI n=1 Tax=Arthrobacter hankyongi TaxID=2904801 RepID=A0ABS9LCG2_9MICC|nr:class Ib ribonucleoside-diphosphate reductase assembly flavoprotein NrdI [Arthrobacter hankyongi]MCG2624377.1 class Ib ribonucleoside-diphosphate reductase assembly flavoprotein NrdI [Arthrobacter hankyongi]
MADGAVGHGRGAAPGSSTDAQLIYFSSASENTHRFVEKLGLEAARIPLHTNDETIYARRPFVLVLPTYGGESGRNSIPPQVIKFLNQERNRSLLRGVIGAGNTNFGTTYCLAADKIAAKCHVPALYRFELMGTSDDVDRVKKGLEDFWTRQSQTAQ